MFDLSVGKLLVLAIVAILVVGPDRLPNLAKDAARLLRTLREMATGAREQLRDELGPEFADVDFRSLNPRTIVQRAVFGDELDLAKLDPRTAVRDAFRSDDDLTGADPRTPIHDLTTPAPPTTQTAPIDAPPPRRPKPGPRPPADLKPDDQI